MALHPTQLYMSAAGFASFAILLALRRRLQRPGQLFFVFLLLESGSRFVIDFFRHYEAGGESIHLAGMQLSLTQVVCLGLILVGARRACRRAPGASRPPPSPRRGAGRDPGLTRTARVAGSAGVVGIAGHPVAQSLSPAIQNAAFAAAGLDWVSRRARRASPRIWRRRSRGRARWGSAG